ncbi:MAG: hypothetical protein WCK31_01795 [bacterium]
MDSSQSIPVANQPQVSETPKPPIKSSENGMKVLMITIILLMLLVLGALTYIVIILNNQKLLVNPIMVRTQGETETTYTSDLLKISFQTNSKFANPVNSDEGVYSSDELKVNSKNIWMEYTPTDKSLEPIKLLITKFDKESDALAFKTKRGKEFMSVCTKTSPLRKVSIDSQSYSSTYCESGELIPTGPCSDSVDNVLTGFLGYSYYMYLKNNIVVALETQEKTTENNCKSSTAKVNPSDIEDALKLIESIKFL